MMMASLRRATRWLSAVVLVLGGLALPTHIASATPTEHGSFSFTEDFEDPDYCAAEGIVVVAHMVHSGHFEGFLDMNGNLYKVIVHHNLTFTLKAKAPVNGPTLHERDRWQTFFDAVTGFEREIGNLVHIKGPHGIVLHDAGQIGFNPDGTIAYMHGPHPQFLGETFCSALL